MHDPVAGCFRFAKIEHGGMVARGSITPQENGGNSAITPVPQVRVPPLDANLAYEGYLQSTLLSCAATICHLPPRFNQVSVQT
jgi:hypothetical protein